MDPHPGGPKTYGSDGSGSATLPTGTNMSVLKPRGRATGAAGPAPAPARRPHRHQLSPGGRRPGLPTGNPLSGLAGFSFRSDHRASASGRVGQFTLTLIRYLLSHVTCCAAVLWNRNRNRRNRNFLTSGIGSVTC
jgi:hypothetical protein